VEAIRLRPSALNVQRGRVTRTEFKPFERLNSKLPPAGTPVSGTDTLPP
jgi:hypothetical protein